MSAFGLGDVGKNAQFQLNNIPVWLQQAMVEQMGRSNFNFGRGSDLIGQNTAYNQNIVNTPDSDAFAPISDIQNYGRTAMPGVDAAMADYMKRLGLVQNTADNRASRGYVTGAIDQNIKNLNDASFNLADYNRNTTNNAFNSLQGLSDKNFNDINANLNDVYDREGRNTNDNYGYARGVMGNAYDDATQNLENLLPGGDLAAARSARAFAPAYNAAQRRLRAAGIDPNSPEAAGILQAVDMGRARSSDDILSQNLEKYVSGKNSLKLGKAGSERDLTLEQGDKQRGINLEKGNLLRGNLSDQLGRNSGIVTGRAQGLMDNENDFYGRNRDITDLRNSNVQNDRALSLQDIDIEKMLAGMFNDANLQGIDLGNQQFDRGVAGLARGLQRKDAAAGNLGSIGNTLLNSSQNSDQLAQSFANQALQGFQTSLANESKNSGWLGKLLGGMGTAALGMIPGVGPILSTVAGGAMSGLTGQSAPAAGGQGGMLQTPPFVNPQSQQGGGQQNMFSDFWGALKKVNPFGANSPSTVQSQVPIVSQAPMITRRNQAMQFAY